MDGRHTRLRFAMSMDQAKALLGFPPGSKPTDDEVNRAYRAKVIEIKQTDPHLGRDQTQLTELNIAMETLKGKLGPERGYDRSEPGDTGGGGRWEPPPKEEVTFDEAKNKASIPTNVKWYFVSEPAASGYSSDESMRRATGYVFYGQTDQKHVFVVVEHLQKEDYYVGGGPGIDIWSMRDFSYPRAEGEALQPAWLYGNVVKGFKMMKFVEKKFNSMVRALPEDWHFHEKIPYTKEVSIKHWLVNQGLVAEDDPSVVNRKNVVEFVWHEKGLGADEKVWISLIINGKEYELSQADTKKFITPSKYRGVIQVVFPEYFYDSSKKVLTRMPAAKKKKLFEWMSKSLTDLPEAAKKVIDLEAAK